MRCVPLCFFLASALISLELVLILIKSLKFPASACDVMVK